MLIFDDIKLVYLANPKTGTTSFEHAFRKYANQEKSKLLPKHAPFRRFKKKFPDLVNNYEIVTVVRDPLDTLYSWYRYRSRPSLRGQTNSTNGISFEEFFEEWCKDKPAQFARVHASVGFVLNKRGKVARPLTLFKYEDLPGLQEHVASKLKIQVPTLQKNVSPKENNQELSKLRIQLNGTSKKLVEQNALYDSIEFSNEYAS